MRSLLWFYVSHRSLDRGLLCRGAHRGDSDLPRLCSKAACSDAAAHARPQREIGGDGVMAAEPSSFMPEAFTDKQADAECQSYQKFTGIVDRLIGRDLNRLDEATANKYFKPSVGRTIHSLHGFFNGRNLKKKGKELMVAHKFVAPHFDYHGDVENCGQFIGRRLNALRDAEFATGHLYIELERADEALLFTHYKGHPLLDAAKWVYTQARRKPDYWKCPAAAVTDDLLDRALARLPKIDEDKIARWRAKQERKAALASGSVEMEAGDEKIGAVLKGRWTKLKATFAELLAEETFKGGKNPRVVFQEIAADLKRVAEELYDKQCRELDSIRWSDAGDDIGGIMDTPLVEAEEDGYKSVLHAESDVAALEEATPLKNDGGVKNEVVEIAEVREFVMSEVGESNEAWALNWAGLGLPVVPMHEVFDGICSCPAGSECASAGKHPRTRNGSHEATTDEAQIKRWWKRWPTANIGGAMGGSLRWLCVDVDPRSGGDANLCSLVEVHGNEWLNTLHHKTGSGGDHFFFTILEGIDFKKGKLADGIDLKWTAGLAVLPPSVHLLGRSYSIERAVNPAPAPAWLLEELTRAADAPPTVVVDFQERRVHTGCYSTRTFHEGERDNGIRDVAYGRWINGWAETESDLITQLLEVNATRCVPPLEQSVVIEKARRTARRFARGELKREVSARA